MLAAMVLQLDSPKVWYGPVIATFPGQFSGNAYDPADNDVRVRFLGEKGQKEERIAYFDPAICAWRAVLVASQPGTYRAELVRNGKSMIGEPEEGFLQVKTALPRGYIHPDPKHPNRFRYDDLSPYYPIGFNLGWQSNGILPMADQIAKMGKSGIDWTRIWTCHWDGKNPWWPSALPGQLAAEPLAKWTALDEAAVKAGVRYQMVLFHHGQWSTRVNPNWGENPWNKKNGGFLETTADFFTDAEAKRRTKNYLRYMVARFSASPALLAWELFNEVEGTDTSGAQWATVEAWHQEMADYVRSIDPYHHPVTSSSQLRPGLTAALDYVQPHVYTPSLFEAISSEELPKDKPGFFGEFGPSDMASDQRSAIRSGLYAGMVANHAGTAQYWYWDQVEPKDLYGEFALARKVADLSGIAKHATAHTFVPAVSTIKRGSITLRPARGWEASDPTPISLPGGSLAKVASFFQGKGHADLAAPITLKLNLDGPETLRLKFATISKAGAEIVVSVDGTIVKKKLFPSSDKDHAATEGFECPLPKGPHRVVVSNEGSDWVVLSSLEVTGVGPTVTAAGLGEIDWAFLRVVGSDACTIARLPLPDGEYPAKSIDLATGEVSEFRLKITSSQAHLPAGPEERIVVVNGA